MVKRILVGLSGTPFTHVAIQRGIELAMRHDAELVGMTVVDMDKLVNVGPVPVGGTSIAQRKRDHRIHVTRERIEEVIAEFESACVQAGVRHRVKRETGNPFNLMIERVRYKDLIIFGLRGLFDYGFVDEPQDMLTQLIAQGARPIIAVSEHFRLIERVVIAYNGSLESAKAMKRFAQFRLWPDAKLQIVCFAEGLTDDAIESLTDAKEYCQAHGFDVEDKLLSGTAPERLLPYATEWKADMIVLGNSVRSVLLRKVIGDTTLHVIRNAEIPLFLSQ